jgi:hypothetical protein
MNNRYLAGFATLLAGVSSVAMVLIPAVASAQSEPAGYYQDEPTPAAYQAPPVSQYQSLPPPQYQSPPPQSASQYPSPPAPQYPSPPPPRAQYAPAQAPANEADYNNWLYRQAMRDYHARYAQWYAHNAASQGPAAESCNSQRNTNVAAGAIFGGVAGALLGASLAGWAARGAWALFGGSVGLTAGAMLGASATPENCEHRYAARSRGPGYYEAGSAYGPPAYARGWSEERGYGDRGYSQPGYGDRGYEQRTYGQGAYGQERYYRAPPPYARRPAYPGYWPPPSPYNRY